MIFSSFYLIYQSLSQWLIPLKLIALNKLLSSITRLEKLFWNLQRFRFIPFIRKVQMNNKEYWGKTEEKRWRRVLSRKILFYISKSVWWFICDKKSAWFFCVVILFYEKDFEKILFYSIGLFLLYYVVQHKVIISIGQIYVIFNWYKFRLR